MTDYTKLQIVARCGSCRQQVTMSGAVVNWQVVRLLRCVPHKMDCYARTVIMEINNDKQG